MSLLDMRTEIFSYAISNFLCAIVMFSLWWYNRARFNGLMYWLFGYVLEFLALVLISLRGTWPDFLTMTFANGMIIGGAILIHMGLERFLGVRGPQYHNVILLATFLLTYGYVTAFSASLAARSIVFTVAFMVVISQCIWLALRRVPSELRDAMRSVGIVLAGFCLVSVIRIFVDLAAPQETDLFNANGFQTLMVSLYQVLFIALSFSLFLAVNLRLSSELMDDIAVHKQTEAALRLTEEKFTKAFRASPNAIVISRMQDGKYIEVNDGFCQLTGYSREETIGSSAEMLNLWINAQDRKKVISVLYENGRVTDVEFRYRTKSGVILTGLFSAEIINLVDEKYMLAIVRDITEQKMVEAVTQLRLKLWEISSSVSSAELMQMALDEIEALTDSRIGFYHFVDENLNFLTLNAWSTRTRAEYCKAEAQGMHYSVDQAGVWADAVRRKEPVIHNDYASLPDVKGLPEGHAGLIRELVVPTIQDNQVMAVLGVGNKPTDYDQKDLNIVTTVADIVWRIIERKRTNEQIRLLKSQFEQQAMTDHLTGLANRRAFFLRGEDEIKRVRRYSIPLSLLMLDVDHFKEVNDTYGHDAGDAVLQYIARTILDSCREVDVAGRLGGEEFGVLLLNTQLADATIYAERLRLALETNYCVINSNAISVTASIGVSEFHEGMQNLDDLLRCADGAMYQAKNQGRNQVAAAED